MKMMDEYANGMSTVEIDTEDELVLDQYSSLWQKQQDFHELFLQDGAFEFMTPIHFEDGMDYEECNCYYASINDGRSHSTSTKKPTRRKSKQQIKDEVDGLLPSCLRKSARRDPEEAAKDRPPLRRTISFSSMPSDNSLYADAFLECMKEASPRPSVTFEEYATVATIYAIDDYPEDIRVSVWMSREELSRCMRRAMVEEMRERREREAADNVVKDPVVEQEPVQETVQESPVPSQDADLTAANQEKGDSFSAMDMIKCRNEYSDYTTEAETIPMTMCDVVLSQ